MDYICYVCRFFWRNASTPAYKVKAGEVEGQQFIVYVCDKCYKGKPTNKKHADRA